ncbi:MAG: helicase, partial [Planctomycetaceae bacterium]
MSLQDAGEAAMAKPANNQQDVRELPEIRRGVASHRLTLRDRLSRLTFEEASRLLGARGARLIMKSANRWQLDPQRDCHVGDDLFRAKIPGERHNGKPVVVSITLRADARQRLHWNCTACQQPCEHVGATLSLILESKTPLGLAAEPAGKGGLANDEEQLVERAIADRAERARTEKMKIEALDEKRVWSDYLVTNRVSGKTYR